MLVLTKTAEALHSAPEEALTNIERLDRELYERFKDKFELHLSK